MVTGNSVQYKFLSKDEPHERNSNEVPNQNFSRIYISLAERVLK